jgi:hypothetical protein
VGPASPDKEPHHHFHHVALAAASSSSQNQDTPLSPLHVQPDNTLLLSSFQTLSLSLSLFLSHGFTVPTMPSLPNFHFFLSRSPLLLLFFFFFFFLS